MKFVHICCMLSSSTSAWRVKNFSCLMVMMHHFFLQPSVENKFIVNFSSNFYARRVGWKVHRLTKTLSWTRLNEVYFSTYSLLSAHLFQCCNAHLWRSFQLIGQRVLQQHSNSITMMQLSSLVFLHAREQHTSQMRPNKVNWDDDHLCAWALS